MARFSKVIVSINGQSQAVMAGTGGGETVDTPLVGQPTAAQHLDAVLEAWMPGVNVQVSCVTFPGTNYTAVGGTPLIRELNNGGTAFWNNTANALDDHGVSQVNHLLARADPTALCIFIHWNQTQDSKSVHWSDQLYADGVSAYYAAINAAVASSFAEFRILPMPAGSTDGTSTAGVNLGTMRNIMDALGGSRPPLLGKSQQPYILRPVYGLPYVPRAVYIADSPDFIHVIRSASWRMARAAAARIAAHNGVVGPSSVPPRLSHARMINPSTLRAYVSSPAYQPIVRQGDTGFSLVGGGIILNQAGAFDNSNVATTGYATLDLTVTQITRTSRLCFLRDGAGFTPFVNGNVPPRGQLRTAVYANPGSTPAITDAAEDLLGSEYPLFVEQNQRGVGIDTVNPD